MKKIKKDVDEFKDEFITELIERGSYSISNEDFENQIIQKIHAQNAYKKEIASKMKLSMRFFCVGLLLAFSFSFLVILRNYLYEGSSNMLISVLILFFSIIIGIFSIDNYKRIIHSFSF